MRKPASAPRICTARPIFSATRSRRNPSTELTFRGGGGLDVYLRPSVSLYTDVSYILLSGDLGGGFIPFTFGAQYHF